MGWGVVVCGEERGGGGGVVVRIGRQDRGLHSRGEGLEFCKLERELC